MDSFDVAFVVLGERRGAQTEGLSGRFDVDFEAAPYGSRPAAPARTLWVVSRSISPRGGLGCGGDEKDHHLRARGQELRLD